MNFFGIGTVANYAKLKELGIKWQKRKENPLLERGKKKDEDPQIAAFRQQLKELKKAQIMESIQGKMRAGLRLSKKELDYLRTHAPLEYEKAVKIEREREEYKRELERARSKEDVSKLKQRKMQQFVTEARAVSQNPNIPQGKKKELLEFIGMRMNAIMNEHASFVQTPEYHRLPDKRDDDNKKKIVAVHVREKKKYMVSIAKNKSPMEQLKELLKDIFPASEVANSQAKFQADKPVQTYNAQGGRSNIPNSDKRDVSIDV